LEVVQKIVTTSGKTLPVADDKGRLMGIISITDLVPCPDFVAAKPIQRTGDTLSPIFSMYLNYLKFRGIWR
jgi:CBS-domain-containing membrane protein